MAHPDSIGRNGAPPDIGNSADSTTTGKTDGVLRRSAAAAPVRHLEESLLAEVSMAGLRSCSVLVACSGGPDSMALLNGLSAIQAASGIRVAVGTVDHGLRPESAADAAFVLEAASALGLDCASVRLDAFQTRTFPAGMGIEAAARAMRYEALWKIARDFKCGVIATAHTMDDQAETLLMRLAGGCGLRGARGILKHCGGLFRPMLGIRRGEVIAYLEARGIGFRVDSSNASDDFTRNRVRSSVLPALEKALGSGAVKGLARFCAIAADAEDFMSGAAAAAEEELTSSGSLAFDGLFDDPAGGGIGLQGGADMECAAEFSADDLAELHPAIRYRILERAAARAGGKLDYSGFSRVNAALERSVPQRVQIPGGAEVRVRYGRIRIGRAVSSPESEKQSHGTSKKTQTPDSDRDGCTESNRVCSGAGSGNSRNPGKFQTEKPSEPAESAAESAKSAESSGLDEFKFGHPHFPSEGGCLELQIPDAPGEFWTGHWRGRTVQVRRLGPFEEVRAGAVGVFEKTLRGGRFGTEGDRLRERQNSLTEKQDCAGIPPRLFLRTRRPGDVIRPRGMGGAKKLKDFFIDAKIPAEVRSRIPLVVIGTDTVVAIPGLRDGAGAGHRMESEGGIEIYIEPEFFSASSAVEYSMKKYK